MVMVAAMSLLSMTACDRGTPAPGPVALRTSLPAPSVRAAWTAAEIIPASQIKSVPGGFVLYALDSARNFKVLKLDAVTGAVAWHLPATPSYVLGGVELQPAVNDREVIVMSPVGPYRDGRTRIVAVDPGSGRLMWAYGGQNLHIVDQPDWCGDRTRVCVSTTRSDQSRPQLLVLDAADGRPLVRRQIGDGRRMSDELYPAGSNGIVRIDPTGRQLWRRSTSDIFDRAGLSADAGWDIQLLKGRYVGWLGHHESPITPNHVQQLGAGSLAAFDAATGGQLWTQPGAEVFCGGITFDAQHPVLCRTAGTVAWGATGKPTVTGIDVSLEGIDPATGRSRWSWKAGALPGLVVADKSVIRISDRTYMIRTPRGLMLLDVDHGGGRLSGVQPSGWCRDDTPVHPRHIIRGTGWKFYAVRRYWPCDAHGSTLALPVTTPAFAGARSGHTYAWATHDGVQAIQPR
jgi:outer membrane protein assembly factor BamB